MKKRKNYPLLKTSVILTMLLFTALIIFLAIGEGTVNQNEVAELKKDDNSKGKEGPLSDIEYFSNWNYPYGMSFPKNVFGAMWNEVQSIPSENDLNSPVINSWRCIGPYGMLDYNTPARYTGRILDVEVDISNNILVASASGGLWGYFGFLPLPLSDELNCMAIGSFDTRPGDANTILLGTGEYYVGTPGYQKIGTGLYKTTNAGSTWTHVTMNPEPDGFNRIRYSTSNANIVHAATVNGYFRSSNGGNNWTQILTSSHCYDLAIRPSDNNIIYLAREGALMKSTNGGLNWTAVTTTGFPSTDVGRISITMGTSNQNVLYANVSRNSNSNTLGIYKTTNDGAVWTNVSPADNIHGDQGWYDNVIGVSPTNTNIVLAGGVRLWRSTDGGGSWTQLADDDIHADQHAIEWKNGSTVYIGNDGGLAYSSDEGATWVSPTNYFPITQYITIGAGVNNRGVIYGGSRDNGISGTTNGGQTWKQTKAGDGGGIFIDPFDGKNIYITNGAYNGDWSFKRYKSNDYGNTWSDMNNSDIDPSSQFYTKMRGDKNVPAKLYTNSGPYVYVSADLGSSWQKLNNTAFTASSLLNFTVSKYSSPEGAAVYACLNSNPPGSTQKLKVYDNGSWSERSSGFPSSQNVRTVAVHQQNPDLAYALINGVGTPGQKIYKTTNRGVNWNNISGNVPDVPMGDLLTHPTNNNLLYLGTQLGCYRTTNAGVSWHRWNNGLPEATIVTEMSYIDSILTENKFYAVIGTYGRSIWVRDVSGDDPIGITKNENGVPNKFSLGQNFPNPFNPVTNIKFGLPKSSPVKLVVYDAAGRQVGVLINRQVSAGIYNYEFNAASLASGVYFYRIEAESFVEVKKMVLVK